MKLRIPIRLAGIAAAFGMIATLVSGGAMAAGSNTGTLNVSANVPRNCIFSTGVSPATLAFGSYDPLSANAAGGSDLTNSSSNIQVTCTRGSTSGVTIGMGPSSNAPAGCTSPQRCLVDGSSHYLNYNLYLADHTTVWDDATNQVTAAFSGSAGVSNPSTAVTVYGDMPKGQDAYAGAATDNYTDSVTMYVNF